jgi:hypothetical protein
MFLALSFSLISTVEAGEVGGAKIKELEERIKALEEVRGFRPVRADWLKMGGEMRLNLIVPEEAESYIYLYRVALDIRANITEGVYTKGQIRVIGDAPLPGDVPRDFAIDLDHWYTRFSLEDHWLQVGLTERFFAPGYMDRGSRRTTGYTLLTTAFWRDEQYNLTLGGTFPGVMGGDISYRFSLGSGLRLRARRPGDHSFTDPGVATSDVMLHDDDRGQNMDEIGLGLGYRYHFHPDTTLDLVGFNFWSRIPAIGVDERLGGQLLRPLIGWPKDDQHRKGVRAVYDTRIPAGRTRLMGEYVVAEDGRLDRDGWSLQASHEFSFPAPLIGGRFITGMEPVIRYVRYNVNVPKVFREPLTWDRQQLTLALLVDITRNVSLKLEQDFNSEDTGGREIPNDEFRAQLRTMF